jgi:Armadillo/beta-catenin-like repeat
LCLGNVAGDCADYRNLILNYGAISAVVANVMNPANVSLLRNCTWTLSNFCRGKPQPNLTSISLALPALQHVLLSNVDAEAMADGKYYYVILLSDNYIVYWCLPLFDQLIDIEFIVNIDALFVTCAPF